MIIKLTTTGTLSPVPIRDLGAISFSHPTTDFILSEMFTLDEIAESEDLQDAIDNGYIFLTDENDNVIIDVTNVAIANHNELLGLQGGGVSPEEYYHLNLIQDSDISANTSARHTQNTDTKLNEGGANEVTAASIKSHIASNANPHSTDSKNLPIAFLGLATDIYLKDTLNTFSASIKSGCAITDAGGGTVDVATGLGLIKSTNDENGAILSFDIPQKLGLALTDSNLNWIYVDYNAGTPQVSATTNLSSIDFHTKVIIGKVYRDGTELHIVQSGMQFSDYPLKNSLRLWEIYGIDRASGMTTIETGNRKLNITAGVLYIGHNRFITPALDTSGTDTFSTWYNDGAWQETTGQTTIDNTNYNNYGVALTALTANRYGVHWVYLHDDGDLHVVYGVGDYTLSGAETVEIPANLPPKVTSTGILIAKIIIQKSATNFESILYPWTTTFLGTGVTIHNNLGGLNDGDYKHITSAQYNNLTGINITVTKTVYISGVNGVDALTGGGVTNPLKTLSYALANKKAPSGMTMFTLIDDITDIVDLSTYSNIIIDGCGCTLTSSGITLTLRPTSSVNNIYIRDLFINSSTSSGAGYAFLFGVGAGGNLSNVTLQNIKIVSRKATTGIWYITDNATGIMSNIVINNITVYWGTSPTVPANSYGIYVELNRAINKLYINDLKFLNLGWSGAHSVNITGIYDSLTTANHGELKINNIYARVTPIGTGVKKFVDGQGINSGIIVDNSDIFIDAGNDILGDVYGIDLALTYNSKIKVYREFDDHTNLSKTIAIRPLDGSENNIGYIHHKLTATAQFDYDETTAGLYLDKYNEIYFKNIGILKIEGLGGYTYTTKEGSLVGGAVIVTDIAQVGDEYSIAALTGIIMLGRHTSGLAVFQDFDAVRCYGNKEPVIGTLLADLRVISNAASVSLTTCSALGIIREDLVSVGKIMIGNGILRFTGNNAYANYAIRRRLVSGSADTNATIYIPSNQVTTQKFTLGVDPKITIDRTNNITI